MSEDTIKSLLAQYSIKCQRLYDALNAENITNRDYHLQHEELTSNTVNTIQEAMDAAFLSGQQSMLPL